MRIKIGIPCMAESSWLPHTMAALERQSWTDFEVWICVNQPREFIDSSRHHHIVENNRQTLAWLADSKDQLPFLLKILNAVELPAAPPQKVAGVGWARKHIFDLMVQQDESEFLMVSLDADTQLETHYLASVAQAFRTHTNAVALAAPYWHPLPGDEEQALRLLRYEIFLRYYQISLWRIGSPYAYLPLGSALAFTRQAYSRVRGVPPRSAAEDFYFLQKLRKLGPVIRWIDATVRPAARPSFRVPFGTGVMIDEGGLSLSTRRFPFYFQSDFDALGQTFGQFKTLFHKPQQLACHDFLCERMGGYDAFDRMRRNARDETAFVRACHGRFDALRTLQYLRFCHQQRGDEPDSETELNRLLSRVGLSPMRLTFSTTCMDQLEQLRQQLFLLESDFQKAFMRQWKQDAVW